MENHSAGQVIGSAHAPFQTSLAAECGQAAAYFAVAHPSLPNYLAMTGGTTAGVTDDSSPAAHPLGTPSIFSAVTASGKRWKAYDESMTTPCQLTDDGQYAVKHNPAAYYTAIRSQCAVADVPMGTTDSGPLANDLNANALPAFALLTPNLCNDSHSCPLQVGDSWLKAWITKIVASRTYQAGRTAIFVTWDEDDHNAGNRVANIVISPSVPAGTSSSEAFTHYSMLRTTLELLGLPITLGGAATATSMRAAFQL